MEQLSAVPSQWAACSLLGSRDITPANQDLQVTPPVRAMEFTTGTIESFRTKGFVESVRRICRLAEEQHGGDAAIEKLTRHIAEQESTDASTMKELKHVDLVQLASIAVHAAVVWSAPCEPDELTIVVLDDKAKPIVIRRHERFLPLPFPELV
jgi:hypothetical protein